MNFDLELSTQALARTPGALHALLDGLPDPWRADGVDRVFVYFVRFRNDVR